MAQSVAKRLSRSCSPAAIEDDLTLLWRDAGRDGPVLRALMANLIVYRHRPASAGASQVDLDEPIEGVPLDEVAERHPSRIILLHHGGRKDLCSPLQATIAILLFGGAASRFGVERIAIRSACAEASLPSIVRRLSLGDVPTSIWWTEDLSEGALLPPLVAMGRQFVYDSRRWQDIARGVQALAPILTRPNAPDLADLNWRRLLPMRQALMQAVSPTNLAPAVTIAQARIQHRPGDAVLAWLLAGWFCSRLGWSFDRGCPITLEEAAGDETLSVAVGAGDSHDIVAAMDEHRVVVTYRENAKPFTVAVPQESDAEAVAAELRTLAVDRCLREALVALTHRFGAS